MFGYFVMKIQILLIYSTPTIILTCNTLEVDKSVAIYTFRSMGILFHSELHR